MSLSPFRTAYSDFYVLESLQVKEDVVYGPNLAQDSSIEEWLTPDSWYVFSEGRGLKPHRSHDGHSGSYSVQFDGHGGSLGAGDICVLAQLFFGFTPGDDYIASVYSKGPTPQNIFAAFDSDDGVDYYWWHFTGPSANSWVLDVGGTPPPEAFYQWSCPADWALTTVPFVRVPPWGAFNMYIGSNATPLIDDLEFRKDGTGPNILTNSDFELWTLSTDTPSYWNFGQPALGVSLAREDVIVHSGSHAVKLTGSGTDTGGVYQMFTGLTPGDTYQAGVWIRNDGGPGTGGGLIAVGNNGFPVVTQWWNWVTMSWDTVPSGTSPSGDQIFFPGPD